MKADVSVRRRQAPVRQEGVTPAVCLSRDGSGVFAEDSNADVNAQSRSDRLATHEASPSEEFAGWISNEARDCIVGASRAADVILRRP